MKQNNFYFRQAMTLLMSLGLIMHIFIIIVGFEKFKEEIFNRWFDAILFTIMLYTFFAIVSVIRKIRFNAGWEKAVYGFSLIYVGVSIPGHLSYLITGSHGDYADNFPDWISYPLIFVYGFFIWFYKKRIKLKSESAVSDVQK